MSAFSKGELVFLTRNIIQEVHVKPKDDIVTGSISVDKVYP
jgi:hypothetical protein